MSLVNYSEMENDIKNSPDPMILPKGSEVKARIINVKTGVSEKNNATWYLPVFDVPDNPLVIEFSDFFWDLSDKDKLDPKQYDRNRSRFKNFAAAFDLDYSRPFDWLTDLDGKTGWVIVGVSKDEGYGEKNNVSKYITGSRASSY